MIGVSSFFQRRFNSVIDSHVNNFQSDKLNFKLCDSIVQSVE